MENSLFFVVVVVRDLLVFGVLTVVCLSSTTIPGSVCCAFFVLLTDRIFLSPVFVSFSVFSF